jgi:hypothetical protein
VTGGGGEFARTGLMVRDSVTDGTAHQIMVAVNESNTFQVVVRTMTGSRLSQSQPPNPLPVAFGSNSWVRLQRVGTTFYTYCSSDGVNWMQLFQFDSAADADGPFANPIYLGIATSGWSRKETATAVASNMGITQTMPANTMVSLALLEYRRGDYIRAMDWCRHCLAYPDYQAARIATTRVILAMCCQHLHYFDEAHSELAKGREIIENKFMTGLDSGSAAQNFWFDWVSARVLLREATDLIRDTR